MWKDVIGYEGFYQVSSTGEVRSLDRMETYKGDKLRIRKGRILKQNISAGYYYVELNKNCTKKKMKVHRLVCEAFHPRIPGKNIVNHIDGNKANNHADNLEWCNHSENTIHAFKSGLHSSVGENAKDAILKAEQVIEIRNDFKSTHNELAIKYGVSKSTISDIRHNRSWKHIGIDAIHVNASVNNDLFLKLIEEKRKELKLNFSEFSKHIGVSHSTLNRWKRKEVEPTRTTAFNVFDILGLDPEIVLVQ